MEMMTIYSSLTNKKIGEVEKMSKERVNEIYISARKGFNFWKKLSTFERANYLYKAAENLSKKREIIAKIMVEEISKSHKDCLNEIDRTVDLIKYTAEEGKRIFGYVTEGSSYDKSYNGKICLTRYYPRGVILAIAPYNYPINLSASKIAPALISGNSVVFKSPTQGTLSSKMLVECFYESGIPEDVLIQVTGKGSEIGDYLNTHKEIDFINFTGSTEIGKKIGIQAGMKPILLELGGKDAAIVLEDANLEKTASEIVKGAFSYSGQRCTAIKRVLVKKEVADKLVELLILNINKLTIGNPYDNVDIVPLIDDKSADYVESLVNDAILKGATILNEFKREGRLISPIIINNVNLDMKIAWEEPFGPILPVIRIESEDEFIKIANESEYGLQTSVFTENITKAFYIADKLEVGSVHINSKTQRGPDNFPFLGIKNSGVGTQGIRESIISMCNIKNIIFNI